MDLWSPREANGGQQTRVGRTAWPGELRLDGRRGLSNWGWLLWINYEIVKGLHLGEVCAQNRTSVYLVHHKTAAAALVLGRSALKILIVLIRVRPYCSNTAGSSCTAAQVISVVIRTKTINLHTYITHRVREYLLLVVQSTVYSENTFFFFLFPFVSQSVTTESVSL